MEIKIFTYKKDLKYINFLENNFHEKKDYSLMDNKTIVINLIDLKKNLLGTICLLDNDHLMRYLEDTNPDAAGNYVLRASKLVFNNLNLLFIFSIELVIFFNKT